ncbi:MAG: NAD(P)/FAD-dependent oxidoreductase [Pseudomonadaceae bacterium]|nr:NAD(P)/FAD-dependent oxidoreductase [Pseudomonadaceae bacterium]
MDYTTDVAIIGAGPSGLFMVFECGFLGYKAAVLDALPHLGGQLAALYPEKPIYDIPGHPKVLAGDLVKNLEQQAAPFAPTYLLGEPVDGLEGTPGAFTLKTASHSIHAKVVVIAGGGGMFVPRKPVGVENLERFEQNKNVVYAIRNKAALEGKTVVIAGGGDSAVDWAVELAETCAHVHVVHRRPDFRAAEETVRQMMELAESGKITIHTPYQLKALHGDDALREVVVADMDGTEKVLSASHVVCCFGLAPNPGPFAKWGLSSEGDGVERGQLAVHRPTMQTSQQGILAIGDIAGYAGKVSLILTGFAEAAVAAKQVQALINPEKKFKVQYSTSKGVPA